MNVRDFRDVHGVSEEAIANIVPESWRDRAFRAGEQGVSGQSIADILPAHDAESTSSNKAQYRLGKLVNRVRHESNINPSTYATKCVHESYRSYLMHVALLAHHVRNCVRKSYQI